MRISYKLLLLFTTLILLSNCTKEDQLEDENCAFKGASYTDPSSQETIVISESKLFIGYTNDVGNGATIEIYEKNNRDGFMFTTHVLNLNESGSGFFLINSTNYTATVKCIKSGSAIGDEIQYTFVLNGKKGTFCGAIQDKI